MNQKEIVPHAYKKVPISASTNNLLDFSYNEPSKNEKEKSLLMNHSNGSKMYEPNPIHKRSISSGIHKNFQRLEDFYGCNGVFTTRKDYMRFF